MQKKLSAKVRSLGSFGSVAILAGFISLNATLGYAATVTSTWGTSSSGVWNLDANWVNVPAQGGFPNNGNGGVGTYDAVINATGADYTVTLGTSITVEDFTLNSLNATVNHTNGVFGATGAIALTAGTYQLNGGTISNTTIDVTGGTLSIGANGSNLLSGVTVNGDLNMTAVNARTKIAGGTTFGTIHLAANAASVGFAPGQTLATTILFEGAAGGIRAVEMNGNGGDFTIGPTGVIRTNAGLAGDGQIGGGIQYGGAMTLINQGLISSQVSGRTITIAASAFTNTGTAEAINGGTLTISATNWSNTGTVRSLTGSTVTLNGAWTNLGGTIVADATSTLNFDGSFSTPNLGTLTLPAGSTVNIAGSWNNTGQNFTFNAATGSWILNGGTISGGSISYAEGRSLLIAANGSNLLSGVTVNGDLNMTAVNARTKIAGGTTFGTIHLAANAASVGFAPGQTLATTILFEGAAGGIRAVEMNGNGGDFTIGPTGVIRTNAGLAGDGQIGGGIQYGGAMTLINQGLISSQVSGRTITIAASAFTNTGTAEAINGGTLTISATNWSNTGTVRSLTGSTVTLNGAWTNLGGTIVADATSTLNFDGSFSTPNLGTLTLPAGSTVNIAGSWNNTGQNFTFNAATGSWILNGGTISGGSISYAEGRSLLIAANGSNLLSGVTVNGDLNMTAVNARTKIAGGTTFGTIHLAANAASVGFAPGQTLATTILFEGAAGGIRAVEMNGNGGDFTIGPTGVIRTNAGLAGDGQIGGGIQYGGAMTLINQGLISSQVSGRTITIAASAFTNTGTAEAINGGTLTISATNWSNTGTVRSLTGSTVTLNGAWTNLGGTIVADATSTLNFDGSFSTPNLGTLTLPAGSTVNIAGSWNNTGQNFTFNAATGSWILNGGTISGGSISYAEGRSLLIAANGSNLLSGVTVNGDLNMTAVNARTKIAGGTTFGTIHLAANAASVGFAPGQTLATTILFEGAAGGIRAVEMNGNGGDFTIGPTGVIRTNAGLAGDGQIGGGIQYGGAMTLINQGLISSQVSGRTITIAANTFTNAGTVEATNGGILNRSGGYTQTDGVTRVVGGTIRAQSAAPAFDLIQINGGGLEGNGSIVARVTTSGFIDPTFGSGGLVVSGDLTVAPTTEFRFAIGGTTQGTQYDFLSEAGTTPLNLAGTLKLTLANGFLPAATDTFTIILSNQPIIGPFSNVIGGRVAATDGVSSFGVSVTGNTVVLNSFQGIPEPSAAALLALAAGWLGLRRKSARKGRRTDWFAASSLEMVPPSGVRALYSESNLRHAHC